MKINPPEKQVADLLKVLGSPFRIRLLLAIGYGEACVCHLETLLKKRQSYISQHLMVLRDAGILETRRDGKYIFYSIADQTIFNLVETAATMQGITNENLPKAAQPGIYDNCPCPNCESE